jgi:hypothetical protein
LIFISRSITSQVNQGKIKIENAENQVKGGKALFGLNPVSKQIGETAILNPAEKKISAGKEEVAKYEKLAGDLMKGSIALIVIGAILIIIPRKKKG